LLRINSDKKHSFPKDKKRWANLIVSLHDYALRSNEINQMEWARNFAYYRGYQHLTFDQQFKKLEVDGDRDDEYIINRLAPFVEQRVAKLTRSKPILAVLPDKLDPVTIKAAEIAEKLSKHLWKVLDKDDKLQHAALYMTLMGSAFKKITWDPKGGEAVEEDQDKSGNIIFDEQTGGQRKNLVYMGEINNMVLSPFDILVAPGTRDLRKSDWVIERSQRTVMEIKDMFPKFDEKAALRNPGMLTRYEEFVHNLGSTTGMSLGRIGQGSNEGGTKEQERVLAIEYWMRPNPIYKEGVLATVVSGQLLQFDSWPYEHGRYPYVKMDAHKHPFGFYGISPVTRLVPVQQHYNQARTQVAKNAEVGSNIKWWVPKGAGLAEDALTDEEGEVIETNPNMPHPRQIPMAPLPNWVIESQNQDIADMRDVFGEREASQLPFPGITAGVALETASELSDIGIGPTVKNMERALIEEGRQELMLAAQYYTDERTIKVFGPTSGEMEIVIFKNTDLMRQTDVSIQLESALGHSKAAAQQKLIDMWDRRIIIDPDVFKKAFVTGDIDVVLRAKDPATDVVIEQIEQIKQGQNPMVAPFDNHILHVKMLSQFVQTPEFRRMPGDRQALAMQTLQQHIAFVTPQPGEQNQAAVNTPFGQKVTEGP